MLAMFNKVSIVKLISRFQTGKTPPSKETKYFDGDVNWFTPSDIGLTKYLANSSRKITQLAIDENKAYLYPKGSMLLTCIGEIGRIGIIKSDSSSNQQITALLPNENVETEYLYYWFIHNKHVLQHLSNNAVVPILNNAQLKKLQIPLPPLPVQQKIAAILDAADAYRQKTKALIEKYDQLAQSLFLEMFGDPVRNEKGWEVKAGEEYCSEITVGVVIKPASYYVEEGVVALRSLNIKPNAFDLSNLVYFSKESHSTQLKKSILNESDIVIVRTGNTGTAAVIPESLSNSNCIDLIIVRPNKMIVNPKYITYLINSKPGKKLVSGKEVGGIQKHFNIGSFKKLLLPIPPKEIQDQFVESINIIDQQRLKLEISMIKSEELFQSLLQKAFNGDLVS